MPTSPKRAWFLIPRMHLPQSAVLEATWSCPGVSRRVNHGEYLLAHPGWGPEGTDIEVEAVHVVAEFTLALCSSPTHPASGWRSCVSTGRSRCDSSPSVCHCRSPSAGSLRRWCSFPLALARVHCRRSGSNRRRTERAGDQRQARTCILGRGHRLAPSIGRAAGSTAGWPVPRPLPVTATGLAFAMPHIIVSLRPWWSASGCRTNTFAAAVTATESPGGSARLEYARDH